MEGRNPKIAILGSSEMPLSSESARVDFFQWNDLSTLRNIRDYDVVLLNVLDISSSDEIDWTLFFQQFTIDSMKEILGNKGECIVLGDPRLAIRLDVNLESADDSMPPQRSLLDWTGVQFAWDDHPGDTVTCNMTSTEKERFGRYLRNLTDWDYSLLDVEQSPTILNTYLLREEAVGKIEIVTSTRSFCKTRYNNGLAFVVTISAVDRTVSVRYAGHNDVIFSFGRITFLPNVGLDSKTAVSIILRDAFKVYVLHPEPAWANEMVAPGQKELDQAISDISQRLSVLEDERNALEERTLQARQYLRLLYEQGDVLEMLVRSTLRELGATVHEPEGNDDDGWLEVEIDDRIYHAALEVKGTTRKQHRKDGLRQLDEWIDLLSERHGTNFKGLFIGNTDLIEVPSKRWWPFPDNWMKSARNNEVCGLSTIVLFQAYEAKVDERLQVAGFWQGVFNKNGVFTEDDLARIMIDS